MAEAQLGVDLALGPVASTAARRDGAGGAGGAAASLEMLPSEALKIGRSTSPGASGKSQPTPPVANTLSHFTAMRDAVGSSSVANSGL